MISLTRSRKRFILMGIDCSAIIASHIVAYFFLSRYVGLAFKEMAILALSITTIFLLLNYRSRLYSVINRYTDYRILVRLSIHSVAAYTLIFIVNYFLKQEVSVRFYILSMLFGWAFIVAPRMLWRLFTEFRKTRKLISSSQTQTERHKKRTLVVGAGDGGALFIKAVNRNPKDIEIVGVVDRDPWKIHTYLHDVKVIGTDADIPKLVQTYEVDQITIAIPSLKPAEMEHLLEICNPTGVKITLMPLLEDVVKGHLSVNKLREVEISDLLGRDEVKLDQEGLVQNIQNKVILVTGAGGSIGSEICRQVAKFKPKQILLLGHGENSIYLIHKELTQTYPEIEFVPLIADVQDRDRIFALIGQYQPHRVYHAAAHKHVPLMEYNPTEAVKNNIYGTLNVAEAAKAHRVEKFVMISTDKAVNPPNVMGASKRVAELIVTGLNEVGQTKFAAVRFGNVLGSRGSVIPLFKEQIAKGGPVTLTDKRMIRYFMTIPEASRLVLQAGALMQGGEIFVLDMGEPVKIVDLAKKMIVLSGYSLDEIEIKETGIRPGEKLFEELLSSNERVADQIYDKIFIGRVNTLPLSETKAFIEEISQKDGVALKERLLEFAQQ